jgi:hypothetical protein
LPLFSPVYYKYKSLLYKFICFKILKHVIYYKLHISCAYAYRRSSGSRPYNHAFHALTIAQKINNYLGYYQIKKNYNIKKPSDGGTTGLDSLPSKGRGEPFERVS